MICFAKSICFDWTVGLRRVKKIIRVNVGLISVSDVIRE